MQNCNCGKHSVPTAQVVPVNCEFVIPASYPYVRSVSNSYECCCCPTSQPSMKDYPTSGPYVGNAFALNNATPYLIDTTSYSYGQALSFAENIFTKVTKRDDPSCINLTARFDFTDSSLTNAVRFDFLKNYTARKYEELSGVLPIIKNGIKFRIHYTIYNSDGGVEYIGHTDCKVDNPIFHFTSIKDVFVQSSNGLIIDNIPAMTFQGRYTITINNVEASIEVINTKEHLQDPSLNPFYTFEDNNRKILLHNTEISGQAADDVIVIGECAVNQSFEYLANVSTRLRLNFIAFTSLPIACSDTSPIWFALNEPTEQSITQLRNEVSAIEEEITLIHAKDAEQDARLTNIEGQVELNRQNIVTLTEKVAALEAKDIEHDLAIQELARRVTNLETIPLALVVYKANKEIKVSQLTWKGYGQLYQAAQTFYATGDFENDVRGGYLIPVAADTEDISELVNQLRETTSTADDALSLATTTAETVETLSTSISAQSDAIAANTTAIETNSGAISDLNTAVTTLNEEVDDLDERVILLEHPLDPTKINVRKASDNSVTTYDTMTAAVAYINADTATNTEKYDIIIGSDMTMGVDTAYQKISSSKLRDVYNNGVNRAISQEAFKNSGIEHFYWGDMSNHNDAALDAMCFAGCANLKSFEFPSIPITIGSSVFINTGLTSIDIPSNVTFGANGSQFGGASNLKTVTYNSAYVNVSLFSGSAIESITLGSNVTTIYQQAFAGAYKLKNISLGKNIEYVYDQAFSGCAALESATIDISGAIYDSAFSGCGLLADATIGNAVTGIGANAFSSTAFTTIDIPASVTSINTTAFSNSAVETINIDKAEDSIYGSPWGATNATVNWNG